MEFNNALFSSNWVSGIFPKMKPSIFLIEYFIIPLCLQRGYIFKRKERVREYVFLTWDLGTNRMTCMSWAWHLKSSTKHSTISHEEKMSSHLFPIHEYYILGSGRTSVTTRNIQYWLNWLPHLFWMYPYSRILHILFCTPVIRFLIPSFICFCPKVIPFHLSKR